MCHAAVACRSCRNLSRSERCASWSQCLCANVSSASVHKQHDEKSATQSWRACRQFTPDNTRPHRSGPESIKFMMLSAPLAKPKDGSDKRPQDSWLSDWQRGPDPTRGGLVDQVHNRHRQCTPHVLTDAVMHDENGVGRKDATNCVAVLPREPQPAHEHARTGALQYFVRFVESQGEGTSRERRLPDFGCPCQHKEKCHRALSRRQPAPTSKVVPRASGGGDGRRRCVKSPQLRVRDRPCGLRHGNRGENRAGRTRAPLRTRSRVVSWETLFKRKRRTNQNCSAPPAKSASKVLGMGGCEYHPCVSPLGDSQRRSNDLEPFYGLLSHERRGAEVSHNCLATAAAIRTMHFTSGVVCDMTSLTYTDSKQR